MSEDGLVSITRLLRAVKVGDGIDQHAAPDIQIARDEIISLRADLAAARAELDTMRLERDYRPRMDDYERLSADLAAANVAVIIARDSSDEFQAMLKSSIAHEVEMTEQINKLQDTLAAARARIAELEGDLWASNDAAGHLQATIDELLAANQWIPCSERLPDHSNAVMAVTNTDYMEIAYWDNRFHKWRWLDDDKTADDVTHWRPLPAPPEEGK